MRGGLGVLVLAAACTFDAHVGEGGTDQGTTTTGTSDPSTSSASGSMSSASETMPPGTSSSTSNDATSSSSGGGESNGSSSTTAAESDSGISSGGCEPALEICDGLDNDCDEGIDEGSAGNAVCNGCTFVPAFDGDYFALCLDPLAWDDARTACGAFGPNADIAVIDDAIDQGGLLLLVSEDYWIGISDVADEGHWVFADGTDSVVDGVHLGYDGWATGQPSGGMVENCAELDPSQAGWADSPCEQPQPFICRHPP